jgi:hypothetical protein
MPLTTGQEASRHRAVAASWTTFSRNLVTDARAERVSTRWAWYLFWTPSVGGALVAATFTFRPMFYWLLSEDHLVEWLQFALCLLAAVVSVPAAAGMARRRRWASAAVLAAIALGCLGLAGEEISWGQRVFGFTNTLGDHNRQGEFNVHNVDSEGGIPIEELFRIGEMFLGLVGAFLPLLTRWQPARQHGGFWQVVSPPLFLAPAFLAVFAYRFFRLLVPAEISALVKLQEWAEVCLYGGLAMMAILIYASLTAPESNLVAGECGPTDTVPDRIVDLRTFESRMFESRTFEPRMFEPRTFHAQQFEPRTFHAQQSEPRMFHAQQSPSRQFGSPAARRHATDTVLHLDDLRSIGVTAVIIAGITVVFAFLTVLSGIAPGNV